MTKCWVNWCLQGVTNTCRMMYRSGLLPGAEYFVMYNCLMAEMIMIPCCAVSSLLPQWHIFLASTLRWIPLHRLASPVSVFTASALPQKMPSLWHSLPHQSKKIILYITVELSRDLGPASRSTYCRSFQRWSSQQSCWLVQNSHRNKPKEPCKNTNNVWTN